MLFNGNDLNLSCNSDTYVLDKIFSLGQRPLNQIECHCPVNCGSEMPIGDTRDLSFCMNHFNRGRSVFQGEVEGRGYRRRHTAYY